MGFKTIADYNDDRYHGMFLLKNDGDSSDVIFMYPSVDYVMVGNTHYVKSPDYNGYVHCLDKGCPICAKGLRIQPKLFIPLYVVESDEVLFWDRSLKFNQVLESEVFSKYPNPIDYVFRITRRGAAGDLNTRYSIQLVGKNTSASYEKICQHLGIEFPDYYETICKSCTFDEAQSNLMTDNTPVVDVDAMPDYKLSPRISSNSEVPELPDLPELDSLDDLPDATPSFVDVEEIEIEDVNSEESSSEVPELDSKDVSF